MRVFMTGATGMVGTALVTELIEHGHEVTGLVRSEASEQAITAAGALAQRGSLTDLDVLQKAATEADGVIHLAFSNDFSSHDALVRAVAQEANAIEALGNALVGSDKPFVTVSGTPSTPGRPSTEADPTSTEGPVGGRGRSVIKSLMLASEGVRTSTVRLPRTVHNNGKGGFAGILTGFAQQFGVAGFPGDGGQRWPAVHALDAASLFRLALELAPAGTIWHAVADEGDRVSDIAAVIGRRLGIPVKSLPQQNFGPLGAIFAADQPSSSTYTQQKLHWKPQFPSLLDDLENIRAE